MITFLAVRKFADLIMFGNSFLFHLFNQEEVIKIVQKLRGVISMELKLIGHLLKRKNFFTPFELPSSWPP